MVETKLRKGTFQHIENELFDYFDTQRGIIRIRNELLYASPSHENTGGGRPTLPSDPTGRTASLIASHERLNHMERTVEVIKEVVDKLSAEKQKLITLKYWTRPQLLTWEGIAQELHVSRRQAINWRDEIVEALAMKLGWG